MIDPSTYDKEGVDSGTYDSFAVFEDRLYYEYADDVQLVIEAQSEREECLRLQACVERLLNGMRGMLNGLQDLSDTQRTRTKECTTVTERYRRLRGVYGNDFVLYQIMKSEHTEQIARFVLCERIATLAMSKYVAGDCFEINFES